MVLIYSLQVSVTDFLLTELIDFFLREGREDPERERTGDV